MAPGYVIALVLEVAGVAGLLVAGTVARTERQARAAELRSFLRSGQSASAAPSAPSRRAGPASLVVSLPLAQARTGDRPAPDSAARTALRRALGREGSDPAIGLLSAG